MKNQGEGDNLKWSWDMLYPTIEIQSLKKRVPLMQLSILGNSSCTFV